MPIPRPPGLRGAALALVAAMLHLARPAAAQSVQEVPNPMAAHTVFIIVITAAFLVWAASFSIHIMRGRTERDAERRELVRRRDTILDEITKLEIARESGTIGKARYKTRMKALRGDLARVLERLQSVSKPKKKHA